MKSKSPLENEIVTDYRPITGVRTLLEWEIQEPGETGWTKHSALVEDDGLSPASTVPVR